MKVPEPEFNWRCWAWNPRGTDVCLLHCSLYQLHWAATGNRYCFVNTTYYSCQSEIFSEFLVCKTSVQSETKFQKKPVPVKCKSRVCGCSSWSFVDQIHYTFCCDQEFLDTSSVFCFQSSLCICLSLSNSNAVLSKMRAEASVSYLKESMLPLNFPV